jgi:hypothetical protein
MSFSRCGRSSRASRRCGAPRHLAPGGEAPAAGQAP